MRCSVDEKRFEEIKYHLKYRSTEELQEILKERNYDEWTEEAFEAIKRIIDERNIKKSYEEDWDILCQEGESLYQKGQYDRAMVVAKKALEVAEKNAGPNHPLVATSLNNLAKLYHAQGQYAQAEPLYKQALAIYVKALGPNHPFVATYLLNLAALQVVEKKNKEVTEFEAASQFVMTILKDSKKKWPSIAQELNQLLRPKKKFSRKQSAAMEFSFAVIALQIQALPNLLEQGQAKRILEYILKIISTPELGTYPREIIKKYQDAWAASLESAELPIYGIASVLFDALECKDIKKMGDDYYIKNTIVLMALAEQVNNFGNLSWWKNLTERYKIVKDDLPVKFIFPE